MDNQQSPYGITPQLSQKDLAVLVERVTRMADDFDEMRADMKMTNQGLGRIPVIERDIAAVIKGLGDAERVIDKLTVQSTQMKTSLRLVASISVMAMTLVVGAGGWAWGKVEKAADRLNETEKRLAVLELRAEMTDRQQAANRFNQPGNIR